MTGNRIENQPCGGEDREQALQNRLATVSKAELQRLLTIVTLLAGADEALTDSRIGLAAVEIALYEIDAPVAHRIVTTPTELMRILQQAVYDAECGPNVRLVLD